MTDYSDEVSSRWLGLAGPAGGFPIVCGNGCPEGYLGSHKFSCFWAGHWYLNGTEVQVTGADPHGSLVCIEGTDGQRHDHVAQSELSRCRYPDVMMFVDLGGPGGNTMYILGAVSGAIKRAGHSDKGLAADIFAARMLRGRAEPVPKVGDTHDMSDYVMVWCKVHQDLFRTMKGSIAQAENKCTACAIALDEKKGEEDRP